MVELMAGLKKLLGADDPTKKFPNNQTYVGAAILGAGVAIAFMYLVYILVFLIVGGLIYLKFKRRKPDESTPRTY